MNCTRTNICCLNVNSQIGFQKQQSKIYNWKTHQYQDKKLPEQKHKKKKDVFFETENLVIGKC